jgi:hypothetical protein
MQLNATIGNFEIFRNNFLSKFFLVKDLLYKLNEYYPNQFWKNKSNILRTPSLESLK